MTLDIKHTRDHLQTLDYKSLFIEDLGWSRPAQAKPLTIVLPHTTDAFTLQEIAQLSGVAILEIQPQVQDGKIPDANSRRKLDDEVSRLYHEHLLIFLDGERTQSLWYYVKREGSKTYVRDHLYVRGQPGDLSLGKLERMVFEIGNLGEVGDALDVLKVAERLKDALDVERVTKKFFEEYREEHFNFQEQIRGIENERDRRWYTSVLLNRLMFIYFLQRKWFIDNGNVNYLQDKLAESRGRGPDRYYREFLDLLFFEGFAKPEGERSESAQKLLGKVVYLNGGLFLQHPIEKRWPHIEIPDKAFEKLLSLFAGYAWNLDDTPGGQDDEISPHILGYIFEKYINQKSSGAYYTRPEITEYLCEHTIYKLILERINALHTLTIPGVTRKRHFDTLEELLVNLDAELCRELLDILPTIAILDPACGSGAFLVSAMNMLIKIYTAITGKIDYVHDTNLTAWRERARREHKSLNYYIKKKIITENLYGVDLMEEGTEIAKLRLFLTLVSSAQSVEELEPLPNIDFNILPGNSLIGLLHVNAEIYNKRLAQLNLFQKRFEEVVAEKNQRIREYKDASTYTKDLRDLRDGINTLRNEASVNLNELLLDEFKQFGVKYEQATWDSDKQTDGKATRRAVTMQDMGHLQPFHWGYEFDKVMERGGFDIIITNPPWEALKPQAKEFFEAHSELVSKKKRRIKNKMRIEDFEKELVSLLQDAEVRQAWLEYQSSFPYQSAYFRTTPQYVNQISTVNGKKQGTDINLYKLFTEQCYNLLRDGGQCGIVIPSGIYTDLGAKQLRELLFSETQVTGLFCFENNKAIFENVHRSFKFVVLTYEKAGQTQTFPAAFMRREVTELEHFPKAGALEMSVGLVRRLSPDSLSVMAFKNEVDVEIAQKMLKHPLLGERLVGTWNVALTREFDITNDSHLFINQPELDCAPLYEGKMMHQFTHRFSKPRYWIGDSGKDDLLRQEVGRVETALDGLASSQGYISIGAMRQKRVSSFLENLGITPIKRTDVHIASDVPRLIFRKIARNTDERTLIATILPSNAFVSDSLNYLIPLEFSASVELLTLTGKVKECYKQTLPSTVLMYLCGVFNSFVIDYIVRFKVTANVNIFYIYQLPIPRLSTDNQYCKATAERVAHLVCVGSEFNELRHELLGDVNAHVATDAVERRQLQAEIDGLVAHLYGLTEDEFIHVLNTFPLVKQPVKDAALDAYRQFALEPDDLNIAELIAKGESDRVEFKVAACWNAYTETKDDKMKDNIVQAVAAFLNSREGGSVLIGVKNDRKIVGLADDYKVANPQKQDKDGYQLFLSRTLSADLGAEYTVFYNISFHTIQGKDVCCIDVQPCNEPVFVRNNEFYVRSGNGKSKLNMKQASAYIKQRWG
ncbi:MAG: hypothetical protein NVSMB33_07490 [Ktedonobacteraceae bacterium]